MLISVTVAYRSLRVCTYLVYLSCVQSTWSGLLSAPSHREGPVIKVNRQAFSVINTTDNRLWFTFCWMPCKLCMLVAKETIGNCCRSYWIPFLYLNHSLHRNVVIMLYLSALQASAMVANVLKAKYGTRCTLVYADTYYQTSINIYFEFTTRYEFHFSEL